MIKKRLHETLNDALSKKLNDLAKFNWYTPQKGTLINKIFVSSFIMQKLSMIVPVYNEEKRITEALRQITSFKPKDWKVEIIVVNDGSKDRSLELIKKFSKKIKLVTYEKNQGKGNAIQEGIKHATGDFILIQDADLEYHPKYIPRMLKETDKFDVVYGSRFMGSVKEMSFTHLMGNKFLSMTTGVLYHHPITDMETGYKLVRASIMKNLNLQSKNFGIEPEITIKLLKLGKPIKEVPIEYLARHKDEKKISWKDGVEAFLFLVKNRFTP